MLRASLLLSIGLALAAATAIAEEPDDAKIKAYIAQAKAGKEARLAELQEQLKQLKKLPARERGKRAKALEAELKAAKKAKPTVADLGVAAKPGSFGKAALGKVRVFQILGPDEMLVCINHVEKVLHGGAPAWGYTDEPAYLLRGMSTANLADGSELDVPDVLEVIGNQTYNTATGTNTIMVLKPFDSPAADKLLD